MGGWMRWVGWWPHGMHERVHNVVFFIDMGWVRLGSDSTGWVGELNVEWVMGGCAGRLSPPSARQR